MLMKDFIFLDLILRHRNNRGRSVIQSLFPVLLVILNLYGWEPLFVFYSVCLGAALDI